MVIGDSGLCRLCLVYRKHHGSFLYVPFTKQVLEVEGHWAWTGATTAQNYGLFLNQDGYVVMAYRAAYEHYKKKIPKGKQLDHLCREPLCVYPNHLEPVTPQENQRRRNTLPMTRKYGRKEINLV